jgi:hypothetical protein
MVLDETVFDRNSESDYKEFCKSVEMLALRLGDVTPEYAEEMMFSNGGRIEGAWRAHVIAERCKAFQHSHLGAQS